jgi:hypothetical protein
MPKFTIKDLLIATALVSLGLGMVVGAHGANSLEVRPNYVVPILVCLYFFGCPTIGVGIFYPFGNDAWLLGAALGSVVSYFLFGIIL